MQNPVFMGGTKTYLYHWDYALEAQLIHLIYS